MTELSLGDYVLAAKWNDGDPGDQHAIGFLSGFLEDRIGRRYLVKDSEGKLFRATGFKRCEKITDALGRWMIAHFPEMKPFQLDDEDNIIGKSIWEWLEEGKKSIDNQN